MSAARPTTKRTVGRPRKAPGEKLVCISASLPPALVEAIDRKALREDRPRSEVMREVVMRGWGYVTEKLKPVDSSPTLGA
jgi:hypothetical protein